MLRDYNNQQSEIKELNDQNKHLKASSEIDAKRGKEELNKIDGSCKSYMKELQESRSRFGSEG